MTQQHTLKIEGQVDIEALHEALCKAIHEKDMESLDWLNANVQDIQMV